MKMGELNKGVVIFLIAAIALAGGYLWYSMMYKPAVADKELASQEFDTASQAKVKAQSDLTEAQARVDAQRKNALKTDADVARFNIARNAVPDEARIAEATLVLDNIAQRVGVETLVSASTENSSSTGQDNGSGVSPLDIEVMGVGTYRQMVSLLGKIQTTTFEKRNKLYVQGRLFNVAQILIENDRDSTTQTSTEESGGRTLRAPERNEIVFTLQIRIFYASPETAQNTGEAAQAAEGTAAAGEAAQAPADGSASPAQDAAAPADGSAAPAQDSSGTASESTNSGDASAADSQATEAAPTI